jgi:hypothetical protein
MSTLYKRGNGRWYVKWKQGGLWNYKSLGTKNKSNAQRLYAELQRQIAGEAAGEGAQLVGQHGEEIVLTGEHGIGCGRVRSSRCEVTVMDEPGDE